MRRPRDPAPTEYDPNDPKGKQQAIHKAESFAEYLAKRGAGGSDAAGVVTPTASSAFADTAHAWLSGAQKAELKATADAMSAPNKGFLASDESSGPWLRAGHVDAARFPTLPRTVPRTVLCSTRRPASLSTSLVSSFIPRLCTNRTHRAARWSISSKRMA